MKNKSVIILIFLFFSTKVFASNVQLSIYTTEEKNVIYEVDEDIRIMTITNKILPSPENSNIYGIKKITGFEQLKNLEILRIKNIDIIDDYSFLADIKNLRELYINSTILTDFTFIENLKNIEILDLEPFIYDEDLETLRNTSVDFNNLENIRMIIFSIYILTIDDKYEEFSCVPKFFNVKNMPTIDLGGNGIKEISEEELEILSQFSEINLYPNPILSNWLEMEKLIDLNIISR